MTLSESDLTLEVSSERSKVMSCDTLTTEAFSNPASDLVKRTFPGAAANAKFDVTTATMTVAMRLSLNAFDWITSTGRRKPGPEPVGAGREAHHNSPRFICNRSELRVCDGLLHARTLCGIDSIQLISDSLGAVLQNVFFQRFREEPAARHRALSSQAFRSVENWIRNRDCDFHARTVSLKYDCCNIAPSCNLIRIPQLLRAILLTEPRRCKSPAEALLSPQSKAAGSFGSAPVLLV